MLQKFTSFALLLFALFTTFNGRGQNYTAAKLELFDRKEHVFVNDIDSDSKGFIWFLSKGKIYRFNGYKSLPIMETLPREEKVNEVFLHILIDDDDKLWIAGIQHLYYFDLKTWKLHEFPEKQLPKGYDLEILDIKLSPRGQVFVRYNNGRVAIIKDGLVQKTANLNISEIDSEPKASIWTFEFWEDRAWFGGSSGRLYSISLKKPYTVKTHSFEALQGSIEQIIPQGDHLILVNLWQLKFFQAGFSGSNQELVIKNIHEYYPNEAIHTKIWNYRANTGENNLQKIIPSEVLKKKESFLKGFFDANNIVDINAIKVLDEDLILATSDGIWAVYEKTKGISSIVPINPFNKSVRDIFQFPDGSLFFCGYGGAEFMEPDGDKHYFSNFNAGYSLLPLDENRVLISLQGGIPKIFDKKKMGFEELKYTIPKAITAQGFSFPNYILSMAQDDKRIYFGSLNSIWQLDKGTRTMIPLLKPTIRSRLSKFRVNHISVETEGLLLSTSLGLFRFYNDHLEKIFPKSNTLGIYKHIVLSDTIWLATQGAGLIAINKEGKQWRQYDKTNGLSGEMVYSLAYAEGYLMAGTGNGLSIIENGRIYRLDVSDGLLHNEFNHQAVFYSKKHKRLYMGGLKGYTVFDMRRDWFEKKLSLENHITHISISETKNSQVWNDYSVPYKPDNNLKLASVQNLMAISIGNPKSYKTNQRLHYKIKGLVDAWQPLPIAKQITLMGFSPGEYELSIQDTETAESAPIQLDFKKLPAFYQTLWFKIIVFSIPFFLLRIWYRERLKKIKKEEALRNKIASDLHDDVGTILSTISMQAEFLQISKKTVSQKSTLNKIADSSKNAIRSMGDIVWSLDARSDNWESFIVRMREFANELFGESPVDFTLKVTGKPPKSLPQKEKQALYLIYKEALNNIYKHSKASKASAKLVFSNQALLLEIKDNGKGIDSEIEKSGQGIKNMEMRAKQIKAKFKLSHPGKGLQINLIKNIGEKSPFWG